MNKPLSEHLTEEDIDHIIDEYIKQGGTMERIDLIAYVYEQGHRDGKEEEREGL